MSRRLGTDNEASSPQPIEPFVEVTAEPPPRREWPRPDRASLLVTLAAVVGIIAVAVVVTRGDPSPPDDVVDGVNDAYVLGDLTISVAFLGDDATVMATSSAGAVPWVAFELCATDPAGCAPLWTTGLEQDGAGYEARLRVPDSFVSPGGHRHDCRTGEGCVLWVTTGDRSLPFRVPASDAAPPTTTGAGEPSLRVTVDPADGDDRVARRVEVTSISARGRYTVAQCTRPTGGTCITVYEGAVDDDGSIALDLRLPRTVSARADDSWSSVDCAVSPCALRVDAGGQSGTTDLDFTTTPAAASPSVTVDGAGTVDAGDLIRLSGTGFSRIEASTAERASWVLCQAHPTSLDQIADMCATPRTTRSATIGPAGNFVLAVLAPDPATVRTWTDRAPLMCDDGCWIVVLAEPFPEIVATPIRIRSAPG